jgi:transcriptional regulator with XRE-family HTH domain
MNTVRRLLSALSGCLICNSIYLRPNDLLTHMPAGLDSIAATLRRARERKGWSQRKLGQRVGLPQSHISKIESSAVDLQTSSLIELARALDLELTLVSRTLIPAVQALQRTSTTSAPVPAYQLADEESSD